MFEVWVTGTNIICLEGSKTSGCAHKTHSTQRSHEMGGWLLTPGNDQQHNPYSMSGYEPHNPGLQGSTS